MSEVKAILRRMFETSAKFREVNREVEGHEAQLLQLRQEFLELIKRLIAVIPLDRKLAAEPKLRSELESRLLSMRRKIASHQAKWRIVNIEQDRETYQLESMSVAKSTAEFRMWAEQALAY